MIGLILLGIALLLAVLLVAALMLSSQISREEGTDELSERTLMGQQKEINHG
jgi:hypothetical protein